MGVVWFRKDHRIICHDIEIPTAHLPGDTLRRRVDSGLLIQGNISVAVQFQYDVDVFLFDGSQTFFLQIIIFNGKVLSGTVLGDLFRQDIYDPIGWLKQCVDRLFSIIFRQFFILTASFFLFLIL